MIIIPTGGGMLVGSTTVQLNYFNAIANYYGAEIPNVSPVVTFIEESTGKVNFEGGSNVSYDVSVISAIKYYAQGFSSPETGEALGPVLSNFNKTRNLIRAKTARWVNSLKQLVEEINNGNIV